MAKDKDPVTRVAATAQVVSAFVSAFRKTLREGVSHQHAVAARLSEVPEGTSRFWARNAKLEMEEGIVLLLDEMQALIHSVDPDCPLIPEKRESYSFDIQRGRLALDPTSLSNMLNRYAFPGRRSPLYGLEIKLGGGLLHLDGTFRVHRFLSIGLTVSATVGVGASGLLELTPVEIRCGIIPIDKIMGMLGQSLERLVPSAAGSPVRVVDGHFVIDPAGLFPAPKAAGRLVHAEISGEHLVMTYDDGSDAIAPPLQEQDAGAYIAMLGHDLLIGKIIVKDVSLQLVPMEPQASWVEFSVPRYRAQLAQGESRLRPGDELFYRLPAVSDLKSLAIAPRS